MSKLASGQKPRVIQIGAGSYSQTEYQGGLLGGAEYARANMESDLVRAGNKSFSASVRRGDVMFSESTPAPPKPAAVALSGYDMFGPESLGSTTRNMILDLRGEVVSPAKASRAVAAPIGGGLASQTGVIVEKPLATTLQASSSAKQSSGRQTLKSPYGFGGQVNYQEEANTYMKQPQMVSEKSQADAGRQQQSPTKSTMYNTRAMRAKKGSGRKKKYVGSGVVENVTGFLGNVRLPWQKKKQ